MVHHLHFLRERGPFGIGNRFQWVPSVSLAVCSVKAESNLQAGRGLMWAAGIIGPEIDSLCRIGQAFNSGAESRHRALQSDIEFCCR